MNCKYDNGVKKEFYMRKHCISQFSLPPVAQLHLQLSNVQLKQVAEFCCLGCVIGQSLCMDAMNARVRSAWKKFHKLLPILSDHCISFERHGYVYNSCVFNLVLYAFKTLPITEVLTILCCNGNTAIQWMCSKG